MKTKYERMNRKEKKELASLYKKTDVGKSMTMRLMRLNLIGFLLILYGLYLFLSHIKNLQWTDYLASIPMLLIGLFFIYMSYRLKKKVLNQFAIKNENRKK